MSTLERQQKRAQAARLQSPFQGQVSQHGRNIARQLENPAPPVQDIPLGEQGVRGPDYIAGPGAIPEPDDAYDVPFDVELFNESQRKLREGGYLPTLEQVEDALFLADALPGMKNERDRHRTMMMLERFEEQRPGQLSKAHAAREIDSWEAGVIDAQPHASSFELNQRRRNLGPSGDIAFRPARRLEDLPPDSYERVVREAELAGLDTTSGFGDNIWEVMKAAAQFDSPHVRNMFMETAVRSAIDEAGVTIPDGYQVVRNHPDLGTPMYLKPTEDGKLRWTLADPQYSSFKDIGIIADPSDLLSAIGAGVGTAMTGNRLIGELAGDMVGRNVGLLIEMLISRDMLKEDEVYKAFGIGLLESGGETAVSRAGGRVMDRLTRGNRVLVDPRANTSDIEQHISETADMMETIETITGRALSLTPAEAAGSASALRIQRSKEANLSSAQQISLANERDINANILAEANEKAMGPRDPGAMDKNAYQAVEELPIAAKSADQKKNKELVTRSRTYDPENRDVELIDFAFTDDVSTGSTFRAEDGFDKGVRLEVDRALERTVLTDAFAGQHSQGNTIVLLDRAWREAQEIGYPMYTSSSISPSAQKMIKRMEEMGWRFDPAVDPSDIKIAANGNMYSESGEPLFKIVGAPGEVTLTKPFREDGFEKMALESELRTYEEMLPAAQQWANEAQDNLLGTIGWKPQSRTSNYYVVNDARTGLRTQIRAIQNRFDQALTGVEAQGANRLLRQSIRTATDEEGNDFLTGLAGDTLDLGNLIRARDAMAEVAAKTQDPDAIRLVQTIDNLLKNGTVKTNKGTTVAASRRTTINEQIRSVSEAQDAVHEAASAVNVGIIFKKNADGEYINTTPQQWRTLLKGRSFLVNLAPVVGNSTGIRAESARVLRGLYRDEVMPNGAAWSRAKHDKFMSDYAESINHVFDENDVSQLQAYDLQGGAGELWEKLVNKATFRAERARAMTGATRTPTGPDPIAIQPTRIIESLNSQNWIQVQGYMDWVRRTDPKHFEVLQEQGRQQIQNHLKHKVFSGDELTRSQSKHLTEWYDENGRAMRLLLGEEYYQQLGAIVRGVDSATVIKSVSAPAEDVLTTTIKWVRTTFGVLTRPQRMLTAGQWTQARLSARAAVNMLSKPEAVRDITLAVRHGLDPKSQAFVAMLTRHGFFSDMGIVGDPDSPEFQAQVAGYFNDMQEWARGEDVEPKK